MEAFNRLHFILIEKIILFLIGAQSRRFEAFELDDDDLGENGTNGHPRRLRIPRGRKTVAEGTSKEVVSGRSISPDEPLSPDVGNDF